LRPTARTWEAEEYATCLGELSRGLSRTLHRLEAIAAAPERLLAEEGVAESLPSLQYALHRVGELVVGLEPPPGAEAAHADLADALGDAREATAEVAEAVDHGGPEAAAWLVHEWRGALFRVRLAQMRLAPRRLPAAPLPVPAPPGHDRGALLATLLVLAGTFVVTCGAVLGSWPLWTVGLVLAAGALVAYRP